MRKFGVASTVLVILTEGAVASVDFDSNLSEPKIRALRSHLQSFRRRGLHHATDSINTADSAGLKTAAYHIYDRFERQLLFQRMAISYTVASAMRLYHEVQGNGRPLVLLHGFLSDNWRAMRKHFALKYKFFPWISGTMGIRPTAA